MRVDGEQAASRVVVVGAGVGGLVAAIDLAVAGLSVTVVEQAPVPGGKVSVAGAERIDAGPTVLTRRAVFDALFADAGERLDDHLTLTQAEVLARHHWRGGERLDLFADPARSRTAIAAFAGEDQAVGFDAFSRRAEHIYTVLDAPFMARQRPSLPGLVLGIGLHRLADQITIMPYRSLWHELGRYFADPRLRQLFGRYATYCGASPFKAPATLMLVAHLEQAGVWMVEGGMIRLAEALAGLAKRKGVGIRYDDACTEVVTTAGRATGVRLASGHQELADAVILNADPQALATGRLGAEPAGAVPRRRPDDRSLSAITFTFAADVEAEASLVRHNVFFSDDYPAEFRALAAGRLADDPTVYLCAQDRGATDGPPRQTPERFLVIVNAPARGDGQPFTPEEIDRCRTRAFDLMSGCGVRLRPRPETFVVTTPADFERRFPATGGALYGPAGHGWTSAFRRPAARTRMPGLYLAGGATHPGPGVPMAALSGRLAAQALMADRASIRR